MTDLKNKLLPPKPELPESAFAETISRRGAQSFIDAWYAQHVAPLFENAVEVYGYTDYDGDLSFSDREANADTHRALLIGVEPLERGVSSEEILRVLRKNGTETSYEINQLAARIEREGIKT